MTEFAIKEYNFETKTYTQIGYASGEDSKAAKQNFIKETGWKPQKNTALFARSPICR